MKTKFFFAPLSVLLLAVAAAFAFNTPSNENILAEPGYIFKNNTCQKTGSCTNQVGPICTHLTEGTLYKMVGNSCVEPLRGTWQE